MSNNDNMPGGQKKGFSGGFLIFLLAAVLIILTIQNLSTEPKGKVSFSHQLEHLVNLDLVKKDQNKKTALNDNLVTFSGKFKDQLSDEAKKRYRYLELLNENHQLHETQGRLSHDLGELEGNVTDAAALYLQISGMKIPRKGYVVVSPYYDNADRQNSIVISHVDEPSFATLPEVHRLYANATEGSVDELQAGLATLIQRFRSSQLGIGSEKMKQDLKTMSAEVAGASGAFHEKMAVFGTTLSGLDSLVAEIGAVKDHVRLTQLRSVRNYLVDLEQFNASFGELDRNGAMLDKARATVANVIWFFNDKEISTNTLEKQDVEAYSQWFAASKNEWQSFEGNKGLVFKAPDQPRNNVLEKRFQSKEPAPNYFSYILTLLPIALVILLLYFVFSRQMKGMGSSAMNFGKSPAKMLHKSQNKVTFDDVAGVEEAKEELTEIVDFLKDPGKFTALGARIPKGVLCVGPPGTGKTLIAKAVAGEADRPFFSISGSDFVEMFVGVGASRIRDLFDQAKKTAPCIVFIDEIDAVGRHRGAGIGGGHDEREQTLNQLLVEMDGFDTNEGVILMAATNRPDVLDKALLRPGRFDRRIMLDLPDIKGRFEILQVHAKRVKLDDTVDLMALARATPGSSGADLMNILNESALLAARKGRSAVTASDAMEAVEKVRYGKERRSLQLDANEKKNTAYHESGHAIVGLVVEHGDPVEKVTIVPRGMSLGATHFVPEKNKMSYWKKELLDRLAVLMGGRIAEDTFLGDVSSGAQMDISQATSLARSMVCEWGMTDILGSVAYDERREEGQYLMPGSSQKSYSDETAKTIDDQVRKLMEEANSRAKEILEENREKVVLMSEMLLEFETLDKEDVHAIMDGKWDEDKKREKMKGIEEAHRKLPPPIPPKPISGEDLHPKLS